MRITIDKIIIRIVYSIRDNIISKVILFRAGDAQGKSRKDERTQAGVLITGTFILKEN